MKFHKFLLEATGRDTIAVLNGRMNPVTTGHEENVKGLQALAKKHNADHLVVATHSHDTKTKGSDNKNPLSPEQKLTHLKRAFPHTNLTMTNKERPSIFHVLADLHKKGYKHVVLASGEDRVEDYERIKKYNGVEGPHGYYKFNSIKTESTGERKPGVSGTDMRKHAAAGNFEKFRSGLASNLRNNEQHARDIYNHVRQGMKVSEVYDPYLKVSKYQEGEKEGTDYMKKMTPGQDIAQIKTRKLKIPYLLMTAEQKMMFAEETGQLYFDGIQTKNFDLCPLALKEFKRLINQVQNIPSPLTGVDTTSTLRNMKIKNFLDL